MCLWKVFVKGFSAEGFRKDSGRIPEGSGPLALPLSIRKVFYGRFRGRFLRKVLRKVFAEGSAEGFCGRFRGRFPEGFPRKVEKLILS